MILDKLGKPYSGSSLARIAVEVGEEEDIRLLVQAERDKENYQYDFGEHFRVGWNGTGLSDLDFLVPKLSNLPGLENVKEYPAILWALQNKKIGIVKILMAVNKLNLKGRIADVMILCGLQRFCVHSLFLCSKSPVFSAMLNSDMGEAREGEININTMNSNTLSSMIHYIYTGELADGWQDLDIQDVTIAADMYDLPGWMDLFSGCA